MKLTYSTQAQILLSNIKDLDIEAFEKWVIENKFIVGDAYINEFLILHHNPK